MVCLPWDIRAVRAPHPPSRSNVDPDPMSADLPVSREALHRTFGPSAFDLPCFYANQPALRFELSQYGQRLDLFEQAWDRARPIVDHALGDSSALVAVLSRFGDGVPMHSRELFRSLRACGVRVGRPRAWWTEPYADGEPEPRLFVAFACEREAVRHLLWGALAHDIGIRPRLEAMVHFADPARGIVIHPYDDRGMDIVGPNHALLAELYHRFNEDLLDYDRERMDAFFASPAGTTPAASSDHPG